MKKTASLFLCLLLLLPVLPAARAAQVADSNVWEILSCMDIMTYDGAGNFNGASVVTRDQLAKILVMASSYKGSAAASSKVSPFSDVSYKNWCAPYVSVAVRNGLLSGYSDGRYRPDSPVPCEEAVTAALKLLGYTSDDIGGSYPQAQLALADNLGLTDGLSLSAGKTVTRANMARLIYNTLCATPKDGSEMYAKSLGYTPSTDYLTLDDVIGVNAKGPVTVRDANILTTLGLKNARVYVDGKRSQASDIPVYSVLYYSQSGNAVWVYTDKLTARLESESPSASHPTSVVIGGTTYELGAYTAQQAFAADGMDAGDMVTVLLGRDGVIADAYPTSSFYAQQIGVITGASAGTDGTSDFVAAVQLVAGGTMDIGTSYNPESFVGRAVKVRYDDEDGFVIDFAGDTAYGVSGTVDADAHTIGSSAVSKDVRIIDTDDYGNSAEISLERLDGVTLDASDILLLTKDGKGAVNGLILKDVTGDTAQFGIITSALSVLQNPLGGQTGKLSFTIDGTSTTISYDYGDGQLVTGPAVFHYDRDGELQKIENLPMYSFSADVVTSEYLQTADGTKYRLSPDVVVQDATGRSAKEASLSDVLSIDHDSYEVKAYYDREQQDGGLIRALYIYKLTGG